MKDKERKKYLASLTERLVLGQMGRRDFLRSAGKLGLGAGALGSGLGNRPFGSFSVAHAQLQPTADVMGWLNDVAKPLAGTTLKLATESTPPSEALNSQLKRHFEQAAGIKVEIELLPLEQVLQKLTLDVTEQIRLSCQSQNRRGAWIDDPGDVSAACRQSDRMIYPRRHGAQGRFAGSL
jgi:multiple sugar transport system substrate-binding protein